MALHRAGYLRIVETAYDDHRLNGIRFSVFMQQLYHQYQLAECQYGDETAVKNAALCVYDSGSYYFECSE